jgi:hypothetical protein
MTTEVYHKPKMSITHKLAIGLTILNAAVIIYLSFGNTAMFAESLGLPPLGAAFLVEVLFGLLLFLRARQRAMKLKVPMFLHLGYFVVFCLVTAVNMYGLSLNNSDYGGVAGLAISGSMWLLETILVWLFTKSHEPYRKSIWRQKWEALREAWEMRMIQEIRWIKYDAERADLKLVKKVRREEKRRKKVIGDDLPEFFLIEPEPIEELVAELKETEPITVIQEPEMEPVVETVDVVPIKRPIGFRMEQKQEPKPKSKSKTKPAPPFRADLETQERAIQTARELQAKLNRLPKVKEIMEEGFSEHYAKIGRNELKKK